MPDYGSVNPNEVATLSLLGNGVDGGIFGNRTREAFDGTVVNNNVERNAADIAAQNGFNRTLMQEGFNDRKLSDILFQNNDFRREVQMQIADAKAEAAQCCCETKLLVTEQNNATRTLLLEQRIQQQDREMAQAAADANNSAILQQMQLQTQILTQLCQQRNGPPGQGNS